MSQVGKILIIFGIIFIILGAALSFGNKFPILQRLGHLPGDIVIKKENFTFYFPWVTCLVISFILYVLFNIFRR